MNRRTRTAACVVAVAAASSVASANDLYWQGGNFDLGSANYIDQTSAPPVPNVAPTDGNDALYVGAAGVATHPSGDLTVGRIVVGHNGVSTSGAAGAFPGTGTVVINGGTLTTTLPAASNAEAGLLVGHDASGTFTINNAAVTVQQTVVIGRSLNSAVTGTFNLNGGSLTVNTGGFLLGEIGANNTVAAGGNATVNGNITLAETGADLVVGVWNKSTFTQTGGTTTVPGNTYVGRRNADNSSMSLSGGTVFNANGNFTMSDGTLAQGRANGVSVSVADSTLAIGGQLKVGDSGSFNGTFAASGTSTVTAASALVGDANTRDMKVNLTGNAVLSTTGNITVGNSAALRASLAIADNATVNVGATGTASNLFVGRGTSSSASFAMTGGTLNIAQFFLMGTGNQQTAGDPHTVSIPTDVTGNQSGGTVSTGSNFVLADAGGGSTYNLSGTGAINAGGRVLVGRQLAAGVMNQSGGSVTAAIGVRVGDAFTTDATLFGTGTYNISGGTLTATVPTTSTSDALSIAAAGTGTFRVIGDDATIDINGNMLVNTTAAVDPAPAFVGTLAYQLEAGDTGLSMIDVSGTATFAAGSALSLDFNTQTTSASSFNVLTAADIIDNGLVFSGPTGWNWKIISGGNGEILQFFTGTATRIAGDTNGDGTVDLADLNNVLNNFGATGTSPGDDDGNGVVDLADLNRVLNNFGDTAAASALSVVPEPAGLSVLGLAAGAMLARRRRGAR